MVVEVALACVVLLYAALAGFSVVWVATSGDFADIKPASWFAKALYWHGVWWFGMLMLLGPLMIVWALGHFLMRHW